jgi:hypothetical protein
MFDYLVGLDLGQSFDYTALSVCEQPLWVPSEVPEDPNLALLWPPEHRGWVSLLDLLPAQRDYFLSLNYRAHRRPARPPLFVRHLERIRHRPYTEIVQRVADLLARPPLVGARTALLVDYGGPGRPVVDQLEQAGLEPRPITIHGGHDVSTDADGWALRVPKRDLVVSAQSMLQDGRLRIASGLEHAATLTQELLSFRVRISASGHDSYSAREGEHDDLLLSVAACTWFRDWFLKNYDQEAELLGRMQPMGVY